MSEIREQDIYMNQGGGHFVQPHHLKPVLDDYMTAPEYGEDAWREVRVGGVVYDVQMGVAAVNSEDGYTFGEFYIYGTIPVPEGYRETDTRETLAAGMFRSATG